MTSRTLSSLLIAGVLAASPLVAEDDPRDVTSRYETVKVADGIYAFISPEPRSGLVNGNSTVIIGSDGVVVVDSGNFPTLARRQIAEIRRLTDQPVRAVVNTHWHWDHNLANSEYRAAFPAVSIISTPFTRQSIIDYTPRFLAGYAKSGDAFLERVRGQLSSGKNPDGTPMTDQQKDETSALLRDLERALPEFKAAVLSPPDVTFSDSMTVHLGARSVEIRFLGRANTAGDAVVYIPDAKVLITGDLVVYPIPYATSSYPVEWVAAMKKLLAWDATAIVPGHGPVERDHAYVEKITGALQFVVDQAAAAVRDGLSLEEAKKKIDLAPIRTEFAGKDAARTKIFDDYFGPSLVENAWKQAKGEPTDESPFPPPAAGSAPKK